MSILYGLWIVPLAWLAISFAALPFWMLIKRRDLAYNRATNWQDDLISFNAGQHPRVDAPAPLVLPPAPDGVGAIHQVTA